MASMTLTQLSTFRSSVSIPESEVQSYIVRPSTTAAGSITAAASTVSRNVEVSPSQHVMEAEAAPPGNGSTARPTAQVTASCICKLVLCSVADSCGKYLLWLSVTQREAQKISM